MNPCVDSCCILFSLFEVAVCKAIVDLGFVVDSSGSISRRNWALMRAFLKEVADEFDISPFGTRIAAVAYSTKPKVVFKFNTLKGAQLNVDEVNKKLDNMPHQRGLTYIDRAMIAANNEVFTKAAGMRDDVPKVWPQGAQLFTIKHHSILNNSFVAHS